MSILVNKDSRVLFQGITGSAGGFHADQCIAYGTSVVAGVTPGAYRQRFRLRTSRRQWTGMPG